MRAPGPSHVPQVLGQPCEQRAHGGARRLQVRHEADALARLAPGVAPAGTRVGAAHQDVLICGQARTDLVRVRG